MVTCVHQPKLVIGSRQIKGRHCFMMQCWLEVHCLLLNLDDAVYQQYCLHEFTWKQINFAQHLFDLWTERRTLQRFGDKDCNYWSSLHHTCSGPQFPWILSLKDQEREWGVHLGEKEEVGVNSHWTSLCRIYFPCWSNLHTICWSTIPFLNLLNSHAQDLIQWTFG